MAEKEKFVFSDPHVKPDEKLIFSIIGGKKNLWQRLMGFMSENYKDSEGGWNYYNDGKRWLFKMVLKKKTIFWATILEGGFRITFYFGGKAEPVIIASDLPDKAKQQFLTGPRYGKIRAITSLVNDMSDVNTIENIIAIKVKMK
ncbi:MAG: DUF3788 family protein [Bacteroidia bacterium]|nr:DUF3788 family protein [Bacteroidia bacterium]